MEIARKVETTGEIIDLMKRLENEYCRVLQQELNALDIKDLAQLAADNQSTWSGGSSIHNLQEQHVRQMASRMVSNALYKMTLI